MVTRREFALGAIGVVALGAAGIAMLRWRSRANAATQTSNLINFQKVRHKLRSVSEGRPRRKTTK